MPNHKFETLKSEILARSASSAWNYAIKEWRLDTIYQEEGGTCLCTHHPITNHCVMSNSITHQSAVIGNVCVTRFLQIPANKIFASLKKIQTNPTASAPNQDLIDLARHLGWVTDWEHQFTLETARKRKLTQKQRLKRKEINERILQAVEATRPTNPAQRPPAIRLPQPLAKCP